MSNPPSAYPSNGAFIDETALRYAVKIQQLQALNDTQELALIQCLIIEAMRLAQKGRKFKEG